MVKLLSSPRTICATSYKISSNITCPMPYKSPPLVQPRAHIAQRRHARGFTLIELIMVIVILGVLAVFAAPRILNTGDFTARGFHDETLSLLRYAQKAAIAQRRTVCVNISKSAPAYASLSIASTAGADITTCDTALAGPNKNIVLDPDGMYYCGSNNNGPLTGVVVSRGCIYAKPDISYSTGPTALTFSGLGGATASILTLSVSSSGRTITVEADTGYVHD
jgi:MSHA pilin protein MshC